MRGQIGSALWFFFAPVSHNVTTVFRGPGEDKANSRGRRFSCLSHRTPLLSLRSRETEHLVSGDSVDSVGPPPPPLSGLLACLHFALSFPVFFFFFFPVTSRRTTEKSEDKVPRHMIRQQT